MRKIFNNQSTMVIGMNIQFQKKQKIRNKKSVTSNSHPESSIEYQYLNNTID